MNENPSLTRPERIEQMFSREGIGWWEADYASRTCYFSSYTADLLRTTKNELSFDEVEGQLERPGLMEEVARVEVGSPALFIGRAHLSVLGREEREHDGSLVSGLVYLVTEAAPLRANLMLSRQRGISDLLLEFRHEEDIYAVIRRIFRDILAQFHGSRVYLFEFDWAKGTHSCTCEVTDERADPQIDNLQGLSLHDIPWWCNRLREHKPIVLNTLDDLPEGTVCEYLALSEQSVRSLLVVPLIDREQVWGYMGIDLIDEVRIWSTWDVEWFTSLANIIGVCMQLRRSETDLRRKNNDLRNLYRYMPMGYVRVTVLHEEKGLDFRVIEMNRAVEEITGTSSAEIVGHMASEKGFYVERMMVDLEALLAGEGPRSSSFYLAALDRWIHVVVYSPVVDELVFLITDITERVKAHRSLERSEALLSNVYRRMPAGVELYDAEGRLVDMNEKNVEIFGLERKDDGLGINLFANPNIPAPVLDKLRAREDVDFSIHYDFSKVDGYFSSQHRGAISLNTRVTCLYDSEGNFQNFLFINFDNTETIDAYHRIREFEDLFSMVGKYARVGYAHFNALDKSGYALSSWYENLGEKPDTSLDQVLGVYAHMHPDDRDQIIAYLRGVCAGKPDSLSMIVRILHDDGQTTWTSVNVVVEAYHPEQHVIEMICVNYDVSVLKETELALIAARDKAEASDRLKSAFLANMSHEIRTPLNAIVGFSELLAQTDVPAEREEYTDIVRKNNELLLQLISDILDLSKIEAGTVEFNYGAVEVRSLCQRTVESLDLRTPPGVVLRFEPGPELTFYGDAARTMQVINNLITNAQKFTHEGEIVLRYACTDGGMIRFEVRDTGVGIPPDRQHDIFHRFIKLNSFVQGSGLGLSICKSLVDEMGGDMGVDSTEGQGSRFWFTLPCRPVPAE